MSDAKFLGELKTEFTKLQGGKTALAEVNSLKPRVDNLESRAGNVESRVTSLEGRPSTPTPNMYVVESRQDAKGGYIKWNDGFIEQWGYAPSQEYKYYQCSLYIPYKSLNYSIFASVVYDGFAHPAATSCEVNRITSTGFDLGEPRNYDIVSRFFYWRTYGY